MVIENKTKNIAIIVGAGKGKRIGLKDKAFLMLDKKPVLVHSILPFENSDLIDDIILVVSENRIDSAKDIINEYGLKKAKKIIAGGKERQDSVYNALKSIETADYVLVHDAARPLVTGKLIENVLKAAKKFQSAIPSIPLKDTVKQGRDFIEKTMERDKLWLVQTPQAFKYEILKEAYESAMKNNFYSTDDAALVEKLSYRIKIVDGSFDNIKITVPVDLIIAETLLKKAD